MEKKQKQEFLIKGDNISQIQHTQHDDDSVNLAQFNQMQLDIIQDEKLSRYQGQQQYHSRTNYKDIINKQSIKYHKQQNVNSQNQNIAEIKKIQFTYKQKKLSSFKNNSLSKFNVPKTSTEFKQKIELSNQLPVSIQVEQAENFLKKIKSEQKIRNTSNLNKQNKNRLYQRAKLFRKDREQNNEAKAKHESQKKLQFERQINSSEDRLMKRRKVYEMNVINNNKRRMIICKNNEETKSTSENIIKKLGRVGIKHSMHHTESVMDEIKKNIVNLMNRGQSFGSGSFQNQFSKILLKISF